jgi:hypothetical protein
MRWGSGERLARIAPIESLYEMRKYSCNQGSHTILQTGIASAVWPAANRAIYLPVMLEEPIRLVTTQVQNGTAAVAGSWDIGIYTVDGTRLGSTGVIAQSGVNAPQTINFAAPVFVDRGVSYIALMATSASTSVYRFAGGAAGDYLVWGAYQEATGGTLPATATFASNTTAFMPMFSLHVLTP